ncbi:MAG: IclR family transcriptional regulator [Canibacter sp.]
MMKPIRVLANADDVIRLLAAEGELSPAEISERLDIPRPSVYRLVDGLSAVGLTEPLADGVARLSMSWLHLADSARASFREWAGADDALQSLVDRTGQTAYLSVRRGNEAVCMQWVQGRAIGILLLRPGRSLPLHAGAAGRTFLAFDSVLDEYLATTEGSRKGFTRGTLLESEQLREDARRTRSRGYTISDEDVTDGVAAFGIPLRIDNGPMKAALSIAGGRGEVMTREDELVDALTHAAQLIHNLGT